MQLKEFISTIATEANLDITEFEGSIPELELPEGFDTSFHESYMTYKAAIGNKKVIGHFNGKYLDRIDQTHKQTIKEYGIPDELLEDYNAETDTIKKTKLFAESLKKHYENQIEETKKSKGAGKDEKVTELTEKLNAINKQLIEKDTFWESKLKEKESHFENERYSSKVNDLIGNYKIAESETLKREDVKYLINKKLGELPYEFKRDESGTYKAYEKGTDIIAIENNKEVLLDGVVAKIASPYIEKSKGESDKGQPRKVTTQSSGKSGVFGNQSVPV